MTLAQRFILRALGVAAISLSGALGQTIAPLPPTMPDALNVVERLRIEAGQLLPTVRTADAQRFLISTSWLPVPMPRTVWRNPSTGDVIAPREHEQLPAAAQEAFEKREYSERDYYYTRYGSPLAYVRAVDLLASNLPASIPDNARLRNKKILDFGFGGVGHLRLLAALGNEVVGVEVDRTLRAIYADGDDQGVINGSPLMDDVSPDGSLLLVFGRFPADAEVVRTVGDGYDVIMSKNTLKNGYINPEHHPEHHADKAPGVDLGVQNEKFVEEVFKRLRPGGLFLIYNLSPAQAPEPEKWLPQADGRSPFPRELLEKAGFEVLEFDTDESAPARKMAYALKWNEGAQPIDVEKDLFGLYTLCRRPTTPLLK